MDELLDEARMTGMCREDPDDNDTPDPNDEEE